MGILQFENIHHALEGELVEVKTVAHVIVRRHGFGVVVYHDTAVAFLADGVQGLHAAPVELYGRTDAVGAGAQYDDGLAVAEVTDIICRAAYTLGRDSWSVRDIRRQGYSSASLRAECLHSCGNCGRQGWLLRRPLLVPSRGHGLSGNLGEVCTLAFTQ